MKSQTLEYLKKFYDESMLLVGSDAEIKSDLPVGVKELLNQEAIK